MLSPRLHPDLLTQKLRVHMWLLHERLLRAQVNAGDKVPRRGLDE